MSFYTDNRFDLRRVTSYAFCGPVGPHGRVSGFHVRTKALSGYPGWHYVVMHGDYAHSVECSTRDILGTIAALQEEWVKSVTERWQKRGKP